MILGAVVSRVVPHPPNVAPITALALFGAVYLDKRYAFIIPMGAMLVSDWFIGFYSGMIWVYGSFMLIGCVGLLLRNHLTPTRVIGSSLVGSVLFFTITNFGVWVSSQVSYPHTLAGLGTCYLAAIPFFRNTVLGDLVYVGALFGLYELLARAIPELRRRQVAEK